MSLGQTFRKMLLFSLLILLFLIIRNTRNTVCLFFIFCKGRLDENIETVCLFTRPEYSLYSSSNVRELFKYGQDISGFVPVCVLEDLKKGEE